MGDAFKATIDRRAEERYLARFTAGKVELAMRDAGKASSKAGAAVLRSDTPVGTAAHLSGIYKRLGLKHGALRRSVRAAAIRGRGSAIKGLQGKTIGWVIGPIGRAAFTRYWREVGFEHKGGVHVEGTHWVEESAERVFEVVNTVAEAKLAEYGSRGN